MKMKLSEKLFKEGNGILRLKPTKKLSHLKLISKPVPVTPSPTATSEPSFSLKNLSSVSVYTPP